MYFQKGKNFIHISSKNFQQLTNYIIIFESFFKERNVVPIFRWKFQPKLQQLRKLQR